MFGMDNVLKVWDPKNRGDVLAEEFPKMDLNEITSFSCITGHLYFPKVVETMGQDLLKNEYLVCALIRDPVGQVLSLWNYINENPGHPSHCRVANMELRDFVVEYTANQQCIFLAGNGSGQKALDMVINDYDIVRPLYEFDQLMGEIGRAFGKPVPEYQVQNKTNKVKTRRDELDDEIVELIRIRNSQDILLYEGVVNHLATQKAA